MRPASEYQFTEIIDDMSTQAALGFALRSWRSESQLATTDLWSYPLTLKMNIKRKGSYTDSHC